MLEHAWQQYRSWAARSRQMQKKSLSSAWWAMVLAVLAALFGAAAALSFGDEGLGRVLAFFAAATAGAAPIVGREILSVGSEGIWVRARGTAEAVKSECFRYAAGLGPYGSRGVSADRHLNVQLHALTQPALDAGVVPLDSPEDYKGPPAAMSADWYLKNRLREQRTYFSDGQTKNENSVTKNRAIALAFALLAAALGVYATIFDVAGPTPWIAACTTVAAAIAAFGLRDRKQFLAASYGAMVQQLDRIEAAYKAKVLDFAGLVSACEDLLAAESKVWANRVSETPFVPPAVTPAGGGGGNGANADGQGL